MRTQEAPVRSDRLAAVEADLLRTKEGLVQELADVDAVLAAIRKRAAPAVGIYVETKSRPTNGRTPSKKAPAKAAAKPAAQTGKLSPDQVVRMGEMFEAGKPVDEIAKRFKVTDAGVYYYAKSRKWKRPNPGVAAPPAAAAPVATPAGQQLSGSVRCTNPECGAWTDYDPCRKCGEKLKRAKW